MVKPHYTTHTDRPLHHFRRYALCLELLTSARSLKEFILFVFELSGLRPCIAGANATAMAQR